MQHSTEFSTDNGTTWTTGYANETSEPGKSLTLSGIAVGTHQVKLRITPLSGSNLTPIVSLPCTLAVTGHNVYVDALTALATAGVSVSDVQQMTDALTVTSQASATASSLAVQIENCMATVSAATTVQGAMAAIESLVAEISGVATIDDSVGQNGVVTAIASAMATVSDVQTMRDQLVAAVTAISSITDSVSAAIVNSFETGTEGWTFIPSPYSGVAVRQLMTTPSAFSGSYTAKLVYGSESDARAAANAAMLADPELADPYTPPVSQITKVTANSGTVRAKVYLVSSEPTSVGLYLYDQAKGSLYSVVSTIGVWQDISFNFTAGSAVVFEIYAGTAYIDMIVLP